MEFSKLQIGEMTPGSAKVAFNDEVLRRTKENGGDHVRAWSETKALLPQVHDLMLQNAQPEVAVLENDLAIPIRVPGDKGSHLANLCLSPAATDSEFAAAWRANGGKVVLAKPVEVMTALVAKAAGENGYDIDRAKYEVRERHPKLAAAAGEDPRQLDTFKANR